MATHPKCYGIIPARFDSTRFPGKPLADIQEKAEEAWSALMPAGSVHIAEIGHTWTDRRKIAHYSLKDLIDWGDIPSYGPFGRRIHEKP